MTAGPRTATSPAGVPQQGVPEIAAVLLALQASFFLVAGLSALPFGIVEPSMRSEALLTLALAAFTFALARGVRRHQRWARGWTLIFELVSVAGNLLLMLLPIGALRGPVPLLTNLLLPAVAIVLLKTRSSRQDFGLLAADA